MNGETGYLGVDVGARTIKMAQLRRVNGVVQVADAIVVPRVRTWDLGDWQKFAPSSSAGELVAARELGKHFSGRQSVQTVTMGLCDVRQVNVPATDDDDRNRTEVVRHLKTIERFGIHPRQFDYWSLPDSWHSDDPGMYVLSLRQDWAEQLVRDHDVAGLRCRVLDGMPTALARLTQWVPRRSRGPVAILDWGFSRATFCLAVEGKPVFVRMLRSSGLDQLIRAIADPLRLNRDEAEELLMTAGLAQSPEQSDPVAERVRQLIQAPLQSMADELSRTLRFIKSDRRNESPQSIILFGGGANIGGIAQWISERTQLEANSWQLPGQPEIVGSHGSVPASMIAAAVSVSSLAWSAS